MKDAQPVGPTESLCLQFNGISGVEKEGREYLEAEIRFMGAAQTKRKPEPEQVKF